MQALVLSNLQTADDAVEIVERKGLGHPDTICDALAENLSRNLCREYRRRFGDVLHHNVDKALLCGGRAAPAFGGGAVLTPVHIYLAGRAVTEIGAEAIPVREIAVEGSRSWLKSNLHAFDAEQHARFEALIRPGSPDLQELFRREGQRATPLANDTSIGVGHAPLSPLEGTVLEVEKQINGRAREVENPAWGEDVKVMGIRHGNSVELTVACALIGRYLADLEDYLGAKAALAELVQQTALKHGFAVCKTHINAADQPARGTLYLTVTGTSAEGGDDGQVGRGNRSNGLITPGRPMSLEAAAGKNPVSHVGKIYNVLARRIAHSIVTNVPDVTAAHCIMVSRIGAPVTSPAIVEVKLATRDGVPVAALRPAVEEIAAASLDRIPMLIDEFIAGAIEVF
jgi:S-adenosylmethionine synthetase